MTAALAATLPLKHPPSFDCVYRIWLPLAPQRTCTTSGRLVGCCYTRPS
jgi:hypothetical protein